MEITFQIIAPHFVAGLVLDQATRTVTAATPIIKYMKGWPSTRVAMYVSKKHWHINRA